ncbi:MAG TPA: hypothetical protein VFX97_06515 [Pyrinomonadaceae bacterium]|nr:hypothetical protein [Pyrinomonadaceae bacterium]
MLPRWFIVVSLLLSPIPLLAQQAAELPNENPSSVAQELEAIVTEAKSVTNENAVVSITARAAMLLFYSDPPRAEKMLLDLWKFSNEQRGKGFDRSQAKLIILKSLYSRNAKVARRLMSEGQGQSGSSLPGFDDESEVPGRLASALMDVDPPSAASVLQQSLSQAVTPATLGALIRLRERDFLLGDYVATQAVDALTTQPTLSSLPGLHMLGAYVFPEGPAPSLDAESSRLSLQYRYFSGGYDILRASLNESPEALLKDQRYTQRHLQFRGAYQAEVAAILAALAPRLQPSLAPELTAIANRLAPQVPANMPRLPQYTLAKLSGSFTSEDPEQRFFFALSNGDFAAGRAELERVKESDKRSIYAQLLIKSEARAFLARGELMEAVTAIRKLEDPTARLLMYMDAIKTAKSKRDADVSRVIIDEARLLIPQTDRNGLHLRALLSFTSQLAKSGATHDALDFLKSAVSTINSLGPPAEESASKSLAESAMAQLNDPISLLDEPEFEKAFVVVGMLDLNLGLTQAKKIQPKPVQLMARLQTIQGVIKKDASKPKPTAPPTKVAPRVNSSKP